MNIRFAKYHGAGNDFILIDNRNGTYSLDNKQINFLCDRHFGIGADGLITLSEDDKTSFRMTYYNADGLEGSMCGNGGRCITAFAAELGIIKQWASFIAVDGIHKCEVLQSENGRMKVRISMGDVKRFERIGADYFIHTGSPHFVKFVPDIELVNVIVEGKKIRWAERFQPEGVNVNFVEKKGDILYVKTFERGVEDHTLSCGTGNTASAMAAFLNESAGLKHYHVISPGGELSIFFDFKDNKFTHVFLEGPAEKVFEGNINL